MIRVMLDSDNLADLEHNVPIVATYSDLVPNPAALRRHLAPRQLVLIDRNSGDPSGEATVIDVERGLFTPDHVPGWLQRKESEGKRDLMVYMNRGNLATVDQLAHGLAFVRWVATLDGHAFIDGYPPLRNPAAVQVLSSSLVGVHADLSLVFDDAWMAQPETDDDRQVRQLAVASLQQAQALTGNVSALSSLLSKQR